MNKAIVVFTNNSSLKSIGINQHISDFPTEIVINTGLSVFLFSDTDNNLPLQYVKTNFNEIYIVYHENGSINKEQVAGFLKEKLKGSLVLSHLRNSNNFYDVQLRKVLENAEDSSGNSSLWEIKKSVSIDEDFLLAPFNDGGLETILTLLHKLCEGNFQLDDGEQNLLKANEFDIEQFKNSYKSGNPDWASFEELRGKLTINI